MNIRTIVRAKSLFYSLRRHGHGHHGPNMPPFARLRPPTQLVSHEQLIQICSLTVFSLIVFYSQLHEETELVWDDSVAPEATIDFDAPQVSSKDVLLSFFAALGFFSGIFALVAWSDPEARNPAAPRSAVISKQSFLYSMGQVDSPEE